VRISSAEAERNLTAFQRGTWLYFSASRQLLPGDRLRVWYGDDYIARLHSLSELSIDCNLRTGERAWDPQSSPGRSMCGGHGASSRDAVRLPAERLWVPSRMYLSRLTSNLYLLHHAMTPPGVVPQVTCWIGCRPALVFQGLAGGDRAGGAPEALQTMNLHLLLLTRQRATPPAGTESKLLPRVLRPSDSASGGVCLERASTCDR